jgi:hypothetical protein
MLVISPEEMRQSIDDMCNALHNSASEKIIQNQRAFRKGIGEGISEALLHAREAGGKKEDRDVSLPPPD